MIYYIATPYSKYQKGTWAAYKDAARVTAALLTRGLNVFSPITHSHPLSFYGDIDPLDHEFWMRADKPFMSMCGGLIVVTLPGWKDSRGIAEEITEFEACGKPISYCDHDTFEITGAPLVKMEHM